MLHVGDFRENPTGWATRGSQLALGLTVVGLVLLPPLSLAAQENAYPWTDNYDSTQSLHNRIKAPVGFERIPAALESFAAWLRDLPLKSGKPDVLLYNGKKKSRQDTHHAVADIDVGNRDLQQCADAIIRLQAEYLRATGREDEIAFNFTSGDRARWSQWRLGHRPMVDGNKVEWKRTQEASDSYEDFRKYLDVVFMYAGTWSLHKELQKVDSLAEIKVGDIFIQPGFPGHACMVADMAVDTSTGQKMFLLLESFTPAQEMVILRNPNDFKLTPWYELRDSGAIVTPDWTFGPADLYRSDFFSPE